MASRSFNGQAWGHQEYSNNEDYTFTHTWDLSSDSLANTSLKCLQEYFRIVAIMPTLEKQKSKLTEVLLCCSLTIVCLIFLHCFCFVVVRDEFRTFGLSFVLWSFSIFFDLRQCVPKSLSCSGEAWLVSLLPQPHRVLRLPATIAAYISLSPHGLLPPSIFYSSSSLSKYYCVLINEIMPGKMSNHKVKSTH